MGTFIEVGTDPGDFDDSLDPCLAAGVGGFIVPENVEIVEICQDPNDLNIIYLRVSVLGVFAYLPQLTISYTDSAGIPQSVTADSNMILNYHGAAESPDSLPFSTACGSATVLLAYTVGSLISDYASIVELTFDLVLIGELISDEFDHDFADLPLFDSSNPSDSIVFTKGLNPQPYALYFDEVTGQLKLQFSNIGSSTCICNINCVDITLDGESLYPCGDELQEVTIDTNSLFTSPTDIFIEISDAAGNNSNLDYFVVLGSTPIAPNAIKRTSPDRIEVTIFMVTPDHEVFKEDKTQFQIWRYENNTSNVKLIKDWSSNKYKNFSDTTVQPGSTYGYAVRMRADFNSISEFSAWSDPAHIVGPKNRNTVIFMLDDVGAEQLKAYSNDTIVSGSYLDESTSTGIYPNTPNIDSLVTQGLKFTNFRTSPYGSPTKASILGGQYAFRNGIGQSMHENNTSYAISEWGITGFEISETVKTQQSLGHLMRSGGARSAMIGKWSLALETGDQAYGDVDNPGTPAVGEGTSGSGWHHVISHGGFNETYTTFTSPVSQPGGGSDYDYSVWYSNDTMTGNNGTIETVYFVSGSILTGSDAPSESEKDEVYSVTVQMNQARDWVNDTDDNFFLYVPINVGRIHSNAFAPENLVNSQTVKDAKNSNFAYNIISTIEAFDTKLGDFLTGINQGVLSKTNIIIMGDNGSTDAYWSALSGERDIGTDLTQILTSGNRLKGSVHEGGVRAPLIIAGPDVAEANREWPYLVDAVDLWPTLMDMAGLNYTDHVPTGYDIDGISFYGALTSGHSATGDRSYSLVEYYEPNGSATGATTLNRGYTEFIEGVVSTGGSFIHSGYFKLIRFGTGLGTADMLYHLRDENLDNVDPFELIAKDISVSSSYYDIYARLTGNLQTIITL